jgi:WD40 repeat protein
LVRVYTTDPLCSLVPLRGHRSVIRCFWSCFVKKQLLLFSGGARDELFVWRQEKGSFSLLSKNPFHQEAYECRIMALSGYILKDRVFVFVGYSDGYIRLFEYQDQTWSLLHSTNYHGHCLLSLKCILMDKKGNLYFIHKIVLLLGGATDGKVSVWVNPYLGFIHPIACHQHQSGVNGLDVKLKDHTLIIATGGDDNAVTIQYLDLSQNQLKERYHAPNAHAAPITGVTFFNNTLCSVSVDQTVACWTLDLQLINRLATDIPDAGAIHHLHDHTLLIAGIGMQQLACNVCKH